MRTIAHISDLHFHGVERGSVDALRDALNEREPDLIVISGDLTLAGRSSEFEAARRFMDELVPPTLVVPGNHDIPAYNLFDRFLRPLRRYRDHIRRDAEPLHDDGSVCVLGLNSARPWDLSWNWSHGRLSHSQIERAREVFRDAADREHRMLVVHHPFEIPEGEAFEKFRIIGRARPMLSVLEETGVDVVLTGHLHVGETRIHPVAPRRQSDNGHAPAEHRGVLLIQAGTALSTRRRDQDNAFNMITLEPDYITVTPQKYEGGRFEPVMPAKFKRHAGGWAPAD